MNRSESIASLAAALVKAQAEVHNPRFDAQNPHFKSKFASLAAVREVVIPALTKHGLSLSQWPVTEASYAGCRSLLAHSSGEFIEETFLIPVDKPNAHGYASAVTYAKRLSMQAIAAVVGDEDDDGNGAIDKPAGPTPITGAQMCKDEYDKMDQAGKDWINTIAADVIVMYSRGDVAGAAGHIDAQKLSPENHMALWSRLDSKQRSAIKAYNTSDKKAA